MHFVPANHSESNGLVERFHSTVAEIFRCVRPQYADLNDKEIFLIACTLYNNTIHSATNLKPREIFYGLRDGEERPLNIGKMIEERNKFYDEVILANEKTRSRDLLYHNKDRERQPHIEQNKTIYKKVQGIKRKTKEKYFQTRAMEDRGRITLDSTGREVHKENIKRL
jgi:serine/threonine-protein phosphatase PP1 catalytic subunit